MNAQRFELLIREEDLHSSKMLGIKIFFSVSETSSALKKNFF
jgi:hypothetical protein